MKIALEPFQNVSAAGTGILTTSRIYPNTLEYIALVLGGGTPPTKAQISRILVRLGQKVIWDVTGSQLNSINLYEGRPNTATVLILPFSNPRARTIESQFLGACDFGALGVREMTLEVTLAGGVTPTIVAYAEVSPPKLLGPQQNLMFRALLRTPLSYAAALARAPALINYGQQGGALLRRMHFFTALLTSLEVRRGGVSIFEDIAVATNNAILDELGHDPQASIYTFDAIEDDNESKALTSLQADAGGVSQVAQQFLLTTSGAATFDVIADLLGNLNGL